MCVCERERDIYIYIYIYDDNYAYGVMERGEPSWLLMSSPCLVHLCVNRSDK